MKRKGMQAGSKVPEGSSAAPLDAISRQFGEAGGVNISRLGLGTVDKEVGGEGRCSEPAEHGGHLAPVVRGVVGDVDEEISECVRGSLAAEHGE